MTNGSQWTYTATCVLSRAGTHGNAAEGGSETKLDTNVIGEALTPRVSLSECASALYPLTGLSPHLHPRTLFRWLEL